MQEVYENFNLMSDADFKSWMLNTDLLEKEKEVMCGIYDDALARVDRNYIGGEGEQYYNETFNTKRDENTNARVD